jgi:hypothetical protein
MAVDAASIPVVANPAPVPAVEADGAVGVGTVVPAGPNRRPIAELAVQAGSVAVEGARGFVRAVDQATDAALDLVTQVLPSAAANAAASAAAKSAAIYSCSRRAYRRVASKYRKNKVRLSSSSEPSFTTEVASFVVTCLVVGAPALLKVVGCGFQQARSFLNETPDILPLAYFWGLVAGVVQMLAFHAVSLVWQMSHSPTTDWIQMTAFDKVQDVGQHVVEVAPYLPETFQGMAMLIVASVSYAVLFFCLMSPEKVDVAPVKEFFTVTVPEVAKSAASAVRAVFSVAEFAQRQPSPPSGTVPSPPSSLPAKIPEAVPNGTSSEPSMAKTAAKKKKPSAVKRCVLAAMVVGAGIGALTYAGGPMSPSFEASLPDLIESSSHQVSELYTVTKATVADFSGAAVAASKAGSVATMLKLRTAFDSSVSAAQTGSQLVSVAAATSASKASMLAASICESVQSSINQVASIGLPPPGLAAFGRNISASFQAAVASASSEAAAFATTMMKPTLDSMSQVPSISFSATVDNYRQALLAAASSWSLKASSGLSDLTQAVRPPVMQVPSFGTMILELHSEIEAIVDAVLERLSPRLATLTATFTDSKSPMRSVSIQESLELAAKNITVGYCIWAALVMLVYAFPDRAVSAARTVASKASTAAAALLAKAKECGNRLVLPSRPSASSIPAPSTNSRPARSYYVSKLEILAFIVWSAATMGRCLETAFSPAQMPLPVAVEHLNLLPESVPPVVQLDMGGVSPPHGTKVTHQDATAFVDAAAAPEPLPLPSADNATATQFGSLDFIDELLRRYTPTPDSLVPTHPATSDPTQSHQIYVAASLQFVKRSGYVMRQSPPPSLSNDSFPILSVQPNLNATSQQVKPALASTEEPAKPAVTTIVRAKPVQFANQTQTVLLQDACPVAIMSSDQLPLVLPVETEPALVRTEEPAQPSFTTIKRATPVPYANQTLIPAPGTFFPNSSLVHCQEMLHADEVALPSTNKSALPVLPMIARTPPRRSMVNESRAATMHEDVLSVSSPEPLLLESNITSDDSPRDPPSVRMEEVVAGPLLPHDLSIETSSIVTVQGLSDLLELKCRLISHPTRRGLDDELVLLCEAKVQPEETFGPSNGSKSQFH